MKLNWNFLGGGGCKTKNLLWGSMDISWDCTMTFYAFFNLSVGDLNQILFIYIPLVVFVLLLPGLQCHSCIYHHSLHYPTTKTQW